MKKTLLSLALISACSSAIASELYNGRLSGMSGAGYVTSEYSDGVLLNPSLGANHNKDDHFALVLNAGGLVSDKDKLVNGMDDLVNYTDYLSGITNVQDLDPNMAEKLTGYLRKVDGKNAEALLSGSLVVAIPTETIAVALVAKASAVVGVNTYVAPNDYNLINNAVNTPFEPKDLTSSVTGRGAIVKEIGVSFAKAVVDEDNQKILIGITPKKVSVETIIYTATVSGYNKNDLDSDAFTKKSSATSLDGGITYIQGGLHYGLAVSNIISNDFKTITTEKFQLKPKSTAAVGYTKGWLTAEAALDLNATPAFGLGGDTKIFRAGVDVKPLNFLHLRAGLAHDMEGTLANTYSLGVGIWGFDLSVFGGKNNTAGAALELGMHF